MSLKIFEVKYLTIKLELFVGLKLLVKYRDKMLLFGIADGLLLHAETLNREIGFVWSSQLFFICLC